MLGGVAGVLLDLGCRCVPECHARRHPEARAGGILASTPGIQGPAVQRPNYLYLENVDFLRAPNNTAS